MSRIDAGMADLPMSWSSAARRVSPTSEVETQARSCAGCQLGDVSEMDDEIGVLLCQHLQQCVLGVGCGLASAGALVA